MLAIILAALVALAALLVVAEPLIVAGWSAAAATVEQVDRQADADDTDDADTVNITEPYHGRHRAPDAEAVTVQIERAAYWPPAADLIRPYAAVGGPQ